MTVDVYPFTDFSGTYTTVRVRLESTTHTSLAQIISRTEIVNQVTAIVRVRNEAPALPGMGIIAMDNCVSEGGNLLYCLGGGNSGGVISNNGGIFLNSPENTEGVRCAINAPNSHDPWGIRADTGISSVGYHDYDGVQNIRPTPVEASVNFGNPIDDPLSYLPEPSCGSPGSVTENVYNPSYYSSITLNYIDVIF